MKGFFRVFFPSATIYANYHYMTYAEYTAILPDWNKEALKQFEETGADHVIYGSRSYNEDGSVKEMHMYMIPLDDDEFTKRTDGAAKDGDLILAVHRLK